LLGYRRAVSAAGHQADWRRSVRLFRSFLVEQSDPDRFYGELAADSAAQVNAYHPLRGALLLDVGGGPGFFERAFEDLGATYVAVDADAGEMRLHGRDPGPRTVQADGTALPFPTGSFDVTYSSNVLEHVAQPWRMADEMVRVTRPGGTVIVSYTLWHGPWGGHETSPWHFVGGEYAARRYRREHGQEPKNRFGESLFAVSAREGLHWARAHPDAQILAIIPRYLPRSMAWLVRVPGLREVACWNLMLVVRRRGSP
jgi:SAM-dependent methyltransferase